MWPSWRAPYIPEMHGGHITSGHYLKRLGYVAIKWCMHSRILLSFLVPLSPRRASPPPVPFPSSPPPSSSPAESKAKGTENLSRPEGLVPPGFLGSDSPCGVMKGGESRGGTDSSKLARISSRRPSAHCSPHYVAVLLTVPRCSERLAQAQSFRPHRRS